MVIVAGHLIVDPAQREDYLLGCVDVVRRGPRRRWLPRLRLVGRPRRRRANTTSSNAGNRPPRSRRSAAAASRANRARAVLSASVAEYDVGATRNLS